MHLVWVSRCIDPDPVERPRASRGLLPEHVNRRVGRIELAALDTRGQDVGRRLEPEPGERHAHATRDLGGGGALDGTAEDRVEDHGVACAEGCGGLLAEQAVDAIGDGRLVRLGGETRRRGDAAQRLSDHVASQQDGSWRGANVRAPLVSPAWICPSRTTRQRR